MPRRATPAKLREYERKRDFEKTREPPPAPLKQTAGRSFMIHKHHATRLHYDLRLDYGGFERRIPDDEYGGGDSLIWERGSYDTVPPGQAAAQRRKGHLHLELEGEKLRGRWHLVRTRPAGGKAQWIFFKAKDEHADARYDVVGRARLPSLK